MIGWRARSAQLIVLAVTALVPIVAWPGLSQPFSTPKIWLLAAATVLVLALAWRPSTPTRSVLPVVWLASWIAPSMFGGVVSFEPLLTAVVAGTWALALLAARPRAADLALAVVAGSTGVGLLALLQWINLDPFAAFGWQPEIRGASVRMRIFATLGNPNFVAALLAGAAPLAGALAASGASTAIRRVASASLVVQLLAIAATGSRAGALAVLVGAAAWVAVRGRGGLVAAASAACIAALVVLISQGRPLRDTGEGRLHIWSVVAPQTFAHPIVGHGPGGIEANYLAWERERRAAGGRFVDRRFAGPQQHAHNDYLEAAVERGMPGLAGLLVVIGVPFAAAIRRAWRTPGDPLVAGAGGSIGALAAVACVDFPFARPSELLLFWTAVAIVVLTLEADRAHARSLST